MAIARPILSVWFAALGQTKKLVMNGLYVGERASQQTGLVSGVASTGAAAGIFLAVFALLLLLLFSM
jgi:hypothetical protein